MTLNCANLFLGKPCFSIFYFGNYWEFQIVVDLLVAYIYARIIGMRYRYLYQLIQIWLLNNKLDLTIFVVC